MINQSINQCLLLDNQYNDFPWIRTAIRTKYTQKLVRSTKQKYVNSTNISVNTTEHNIEPAANPLPQGPGTARWSRRGAGETSTPRVPPEAGRRQSADGREAAVGRQGGGSRRTAA